MTRTTNRQRVLDYILAHGSITQIDAYEHLRPRITSVSQEISRLEQEGYVFDHVPEKGQGTHWTRYKLRAKETDLGDGWKTREYKIADFHIDLAPKSSDASTISQPTSQPSWRGKSTKYACPKGHPFKLWGEHDNEKAECTQHFVKGIRLKNQE